MGDPIYKIGTLNPLYSSRFRDNLQTHYDKFKINVLNKVFDSVFNSKSDQSVTGNLRGVVIKDNSFGLEEKVPIFFDTNIFSNITDKYVNIHVRIPEIHGYLPDPDNFEFGTPEYENIIRLYPVFTGVEKTNRKPIYGDIVLVSFFNPKEKSMGGTYLETLSTSGDLIKQQQIVNASDPFKKNGGDIRLITGDGIYVPGDGKNYEKIKGYAVNGDTSYISSQLEPYYPNNMTLSKDDMAKLIYIVSSRCTTRPDFVSTQDKLTMGFRRLAVGGLEELLVKNYGITIDEATANNYAKAIEISNDPNWYKIQMEDFSTQIERNLRKHKFRKGREIALFERVYNSNHSVAENNKNSYEQLRNAYIRLKDEKGRERIEKLEAFIPANEVWR